MKNRFSIDTNVFHKKKKEKKEKGRKKEVYPKFMWKHPLISYKIMIKSKEDRHNTGMEEWASSRVAYPALPIFL